MCRASSECVWIAGTGLLDEEVQEGWVWQRWRPRLAHGSSLGNRLVGLQVLGGTSSSERSELFLYKRRIQQAVAVGTGPEI